MQTHVVAIGDTLTPLGAQLKQKNDDGELEVKDLTSHTVKVTVVDTEGTEVLAETTTGITVTTALTGKIQWTLPSSLVSVARVCYVYFYVYGAGADSTKRDTYPTPDYDEKKLKLIVKAL